MSLPPAASRSWRHRLLGWFTSPSNLLSTNVDPLTLPPDLSVDDPADLSLARGYPSVPDPADEVLELRRRVDQLYQAGAIDEGTPTVLDERTEAIRGLRLNRAERECLDREWQLGWHIAYLEGRIAIRDKRITDCEEELREIEAALGTLAAERVSAASRATSVLDRGLRPRWQRGKP